MVFKTIDSSIKSQLSLTKVNTVDIDVDVILVVDIEYLSTLTLVNILLN